MHLLLIKLASLLCMHPINFLQFAEAYKNLQNITRRHIHVHEPLIYDSVLVAALTMHVAQLRTLRLFGLNYTMKHDIIERVIQRDLQRYRFPGLTVSCTCTPCMEYTYAHIICVHLKFLSVLKGRIQFYQQIHRFRAVDRFLALQYNLLPGSGQTWTKPCT